MAPLPPLRKLKKPLSGGHYTNSPTDEPILKDICADDTQCNAFDVSSFHTRNTTALYDTLLGIKAANGTSPAALCSVTSGGLNTPSMKWLNCDNGHYTNINSFDLPPNLIYSSCQKDPRYVGFLIRNDRGAGILLVQLGWFKIEEVGHP
jgi:hypothetical protein